MGLDLLYKCDISEFAIRFSMADWATLEQLETHLPEEVATMVDVPDFGEAVCVPLRTLSAAIEKIDRFLRDQPSLLPYTYVFKCEYISVGEERIVIDQFSSGGQSGFRLPGDDEHWYAIWAGLDECRLEKIAAQPDGTGQVVEERDLRSERELQTANSGLVQIRRRRAKTSLRKGLARIRAFLASLPDEAEITKILC